MSIDRSSPILAVLERLPLSAVICDITDGTVLWTNARNIQLAGASDPAKLVGLNILQFLESEQHGVALHDIELVSRGESPPPIVYRLRRLDGGRADVQIASVPIRFDNRACMLSLVTDVSEREQTLRELTYSEERYRLLVEALPQGIVVAVDDEIVYASPRLVTVLHARDSSDLVGKCWHDFVDKSRHRTSRQAVRRLVGSGEPIGPYQVTLCCLDGAKLDATAQTTLVRWHGDVATQTLIHTGTGDTP